MNLPITLANVQDWFPAPHVENPLAGDPWWQLQSLGLLTALQYFRLIPDSMERQQALVELRRSIDTALLVVPAPSDEDIQKRLAQTLAPYCPSPVEIVDLMLTEAKLQSGESLLDLGSGDGRIVFAAARRGAHARGIEIDARFVAEATEKAAADPTYRWATFDHGRIEDLDWGRPDVVTCYLVSHGMNALKAKFQSLPLGTRIVSHAFGIEGWPPDHVTYAGTTPICRWVVR